MKQLPSPSKKSARYNSSPRRLGPRSTASLVAVAIGALFGAAHCGSSDDSPSAFGRGGYASDASTDVPADGSPPDSWLTLPDGAEAGGAETGADGGDGGLSGCGTGVIEPGENCDDGNSTSGDGCSSDCKTLEKDFACPTPGAKCISTVQCGDGKISGAETCDDTNAKPGDGCSSDCTLEGGWSCPVVGKPCVAAECGDGLVVGNEECDDANPGSNDGCSSGCKLEKGWACETPAQACHPTVCNDGTKEGTEPCDDGNQIIGDGCNPFCEVEPNCGAGPCSSACGDGLILPGDNEQCDDGNTKDGDGCTSSCLVESGFECSSVASQLPATLDVPVTFRDFVSLPVAGGPPRHPDFEIFGGSAATAGMVQPLLSAQGKPVYTGICEAAGTSGSCPYGQQSTSQAAFDQWYRDTPGVNQTHVGKISLAKQASGSYFFPDSGFFPLDGKGWTGASLEQTDIGHNFGFTSELRTWFEYKGGEQLLFQGDDDVWVFINHRLAVDIGGLHPPVSKGITLDGAEAAKLALQVGKIYETVLFHAERRTQGSNFNLTLVGFTSARSTCSPNCGDGVVVGDEVCDDGVNNGGYGSCMPECKGRGPSCGDGQEQKPQEECDDATNLTTYGQGGKPACAPGCVWSAYCGDGTIDSLFGEECDTGINPGGYGKCRPDCRLDARCGDGQTQSQYGETCDDGNTVSGDGCSLDCLKEGPK